MYYTQPRGVQRINIPAHILIMTSDNDSWLCLGPSVGKALQVLSAGAHLQPCSHIQDYTYIYVINTFSVLHVDLDHA